MRLGDFMSQFDKAILEIKRLFDKSQIKEQGLALKKDGALFQAARTFYLAIVDFERREYVRMDEVNKKQDGVRAQSSPNNLVISETQKRVRAAESIARHSIDGPWLARAYKAHDAALAYIKNVPQLPLYVTVDQVINAAVAHGEAISNSLYDSGVEPLDSESGLDRLAIAETLVARLKKNFSDR